MDKKRKNQIIELVNKLEKPYDEIHGILERLTEFYEVSELASAAKEMLSLMNRFIIIEQIEKRLRPELYSVKQHCDKINQEAC